MKRLILLAMIVGALFAVTPSHAACQSALGGQLCTLDYNNPHDVCAGAFNYAATNGEACVDTNDNAWSDAFVSAWGSPIPDNYYDFQLWTNNGYTSLYTYFDDVACLYAAVDIPGQDLDEGLC